MKALKEMMFKKFRALRATARNTKGFTLVELSVVIVIIGVLAAIAVPQFKSAVERSKAGEAFNYLAALRSSEERYMGRQGSYAASTSDLDINIGLPKYFDVGTITADESAWSCTLTRKTGSSGYGQYTVIFTQDGYDATSTIPAAVNPQST